MIRQLLRYPSARAAFVILAVVAILAVFGPFLAPHDPLAQARHCCNHPARDTGWAPMP